LNYDVANPPARRTPWIIAIAAGFAPCFYDFALLEPPSMRSCFHLLKLDGIKMCGTSESTRTNFISCQLFVRVCAFAALRFWE
jgi:hypothetical protein